MEQEEAPIRLKEMYIMKTLSFFILSGPVYWVRPYLLMRG